MFDGDTIQSLRLVNCYFNTAIEAKVLEELSAGHEAELINIEEQLKELQDKVVKNVNNNVNVKPLAYAVPWKFEIL